MKLGRNLLAGFANSVWSALVSLVVVPFYLKYLGIEAYGLVGFFAAMQALFQVLDLGLAPTVNREVARFSACGAISNAGKLLRTLAVVYWSMAVVIALLVIAGAPYISHYWLQSSKLSDKSVVQSIMLMGLIIAFRWPGGLYLGALMGAERLTVSSAINIFITTLGNVGAVFVVALVSPTIQAFFLWQAFASLVRAFVVQRFAWRFIGSSAEARFSLQELKRIWRFSAGMGIVAILGVLLMQMDKILLSKIVSLEELGKYTLAGVAVRILYLFLTPVFSAIYPRLSVLAARGQDIEIKQLYKTGTRLLMAVIFPVATAVAIFSKDLFLLWTGNPNVAQSIPLVVSFLLLGTAMNGAMHFPYALQLAFGMSRLPVLINSILIVVFIPLLIVLAEKYGIVGGGAAWAILNCLYVFIGTWLTHRKLLKGVAIGWILGDVGIPLVLSLIVVAGGGLIVRMQSFGSYINIFCGACLAVAAFLVLVGISPGIVSRSRQILIHN